MDAQNPRIFEETSGIKITNINPYVGLNIICSFTKYMIKPRNFLNLGILDLTLKPPYLR